jgi:hypothetical protein
MPIDELMPLPTVNRVQVASTIVTRVRAASRYNMKSINAEFKLIRDFEVYLTAEELSERAHWLGQKETDLGRILPQVTGCMTVN